jgi:dihydroorotase
LCFSCAASILHLTTEAETHLFQCTATREKNNNRSFGASSWFSDKDYERLGNAYQMESCHKTEQDKEGLLKALLDDRIDIITTDHAPTLEEKENPIFNLCQAPMVQHSQLHVEFINKNSFH